MPEPDDKQKTGGDALEPKTYDQAFVTRLKNEAAEYRVQLDAAAKERDELKGFKAEVERKEAESKGEYDKARATLEAQLLAEKKAREDDNAARDARYVVGEAKAAATKLGIIDGLESKIGSLADLKDLKIEGDGSVPGLQERIEKLKTENPTWFKDPAQNAGRAGASPGGGGNGNGARLSDADLRSKLDQIRAA